jgi:predicted nuclease of predicted toxin-antitoxin system
MRFLLDAQLPRSLAQRICESGHEAFHMTESLPMSATDIEVAEKANSLNAVLVAKDEDFVSLSARDILRTPLLWVRSGNMTTRRLWLLLEPLLPEAVCAFEAGDRIVEIR